MDPEETKFRGKNKDNHDEHEVVGTLTKAQAKRLVLKTDLVVMPLAIICMTIAFLDKVSYLCM